MAQGGDQEPRGHGEAAARRGGARRDATLAGGVEVGGPRGGEEIQIEWVEVVENRAARRLRPTAARGAAGQGQGAAASTPATPSPWSSP